jgi:hypothetical protein
VGQANLERSAFQIGKARMLEKPGKIDKNEQISHKLRFVVKEKEQSVRIFKSPLLDGKVRL